MGKSWMRFLLLLLSLGFALSRGAVEATTLERLYQIKLKPPAKVASFALGSQKPYMAVVQPGRSKGSWTASAWDRAANTPVYTETFRGYVAGDPAPVVRFSPDDAWLAIGLRTDVVLVDTSTWKPGATLARAPALAPVVRVNGLSFSPDGKILMVRYMVPAVPNEQQPAVPYDVASRQPLRVHILTGPIDYLTVGDTDGPWFATVERELAKQPFFIIRQLAAAPEEITRWIITTVPDPRLAQKDLWRQAHFCQGPELCSRAVDLSESGGKIHGVFLDPKGQTLAVWDAKSGAFERLLVKSSRGPVAAAVALRAPRAAAVVPASPSPALVVWDLESGKEILRKEWAAGEAPWRTLALSADGRYLAAQDGAASLTVYAIKP